MSQGTWSTERKRLYWVWGDMLSRCRNPNHRQYKDYGGRGVTVCEEWSDFLTFERDMAPRPQGLTLDRRDNSLGYRASNCHWADRKAQNSNRRNCIHVDWDGETVTLKEYCRRKGLPYRPIVKRIQDRGWPIQEALTLPMGARLFDRRGRRVSA